MDQTRVLNQGPGSSQQAPRPGQPGRGSGNVPYAPGLMSGRLGGQSQVPQARQVAAPPRPINGNTPPSPSGPGATPQAAPAGPAAGMGGGPNPQAWTAFYLSFLDGWMKAIKESVNKPLVGGMY